ncbi:MAG: DUF808 domain-containing protein [Rhodobacteraceae bacterium]|nr:DUF808 domain-containing protein [Paracoccaceae bacterium]
MSGLMALLDDVAGLAKMAAASVDDVAAQATKAGAKAAGAVIDDAAVTPGYMRGFSPAREVPMVWRIARASLFNKLVFLLPAGLLLSNFAPWLIPILLLFGGAYLCFEGAEKVAHAFGAGKGHGGPDGSHVEGATAKLEEAKVKGAIKTDVILSAEIMTIALDAIPKSTLWMEAATLVTVAIGITVMVYGAVALIVKADDLGLWMARTGRTALTRAAGRGLVRGMPVFIAALTVVGTAAMIWVGGSIILHALDQLGWSAPYDWVHHVTVAAVDALPASAAAWRGVVDWAVTATLDGVFGLALGLALIPVGVKLVAPLWARIVPAG